MNLRDQAKWLADTAHIARHVRQFPSGRVVSYVANAGLGNRLRAWYFAHTLAGQDGRTLVHRWRANTALGATFGELFPELSNPKRCGFRTWSLLRKPPVGGASDRFEPFETAAAVVILSRDWQYTPAEAWIAAGLPEPRLVAAFRQAVLDDTPPARRVLAVHVRIGDFREIGQSPPIQAFISAAERLFRTSGAGFERIELFSDNIELCHDRFAAHFGAGVIGSGEEADASSKRGRLDAARTALRRFRAMAMCGGAVLSGHSSFGAMATALGGIPADRTTVVTT